MTDADVDARSPPVPAPGDAADETLLADLRRVARRDDTGDPPTPDDYTTHGAHPPDRLADRFGSWGGALDAAGAADGAPRRVSTADLRADVRRVARVVAEGGGGGGDRRRPPTVTDYADHGAYSVPLVYDRFGSWPEALEAAGAGGTDGTDAGPGPGPPRVGDVAIARDLRRVAGLDATADPPTTADYRAHGRYSPSTVGRAFESWGSALDAAGLDGDAARERAAERVPDDDLLDDLRRVADREDTADPPTATDYDRHGAHSRSTLGRHFGSWAGALRRAGLAPE